MSTGEDRDVRLDKWLWAARFFKTRSLAAEAIDGGKVDVNDERAKRSRAIRAGDRIRIRQPPFVREIQVRALSDQRGPAAVATALYVETPDSQRAREALALQLKALGSPAFRDRGKPGKKDRRNINRLRGRDD